MLPVRVEKKLARNQAERYRSAVFSFLGGNR